MSYYRRHYCHKKYYRKNDDKNVFDMLFDIIIFIVTGLGILFGTLLFKLFKLIFDNRHKIKGLFKINDELVTNNINIHTETLENNIPINEHGRTTNTIEGVPPTESLSKKYSLKERQITEAEEFFLGILRKVVGSAYRIEPQVQLSSIVTPTDSNNHYTNYTDFNRIKAKSIDFVLFDNNKPYLAIELDDRSHFRWDRMKRDQFINDLMNEVGLRIIRVRVSQYYNENWLREQIFGSR